MEVRAVRPTCRIEALRRERFPTPTRSRRAQGCALASLPRAHPAAVILRCEPASAGEPRRMSGPAGTAPAEVARRPSPFEARALKRPRTSRVTDWDGCGWRAGLGRTTEHESDGACQPCLRTRVRHVSELNTLCGARVKTGR